MATVNNNWPTPVATDLVKDGWEAIKDLGDAIDTTLGVYAPPATGLTLINTTSFSAVASQSVNDVFSATYDNYLILTNIQNTVGDSNLTFRLRVSGTDNSASNYQWVTKYNTSSNSAFVGDATPGGTTTSWKIQDISLNTTGNATINIFNPFATKHTTFKSLDTFSLSPVFSIERGGATTVTTSYTGFTVIAGSNSITGTISVYGFNK
jgi:hypothetical protein